MTPLAQYAIKVGLSAIIIVAISEIAKRSTGFAALVASLPLTSLLVLGWLYADTRDARQVADLSMSIFWFVLGSLPFFVVLALGLRNGWHVGLAASVAMAAGFVGVSLTQWLLARIP